MQRNKLNRHDITPINGKSIQMTEGPRIFTNGAFKMCRFGKPRGMHALYFDEYFKLHQKRVQYNRTIKSFVGL